MWKELSVASPYLLNIFPQGKRCSRVLGVLGKASCALQLNYIAAVSVCGCLLLRIDQYVAKNMGLILHPFPFRPCEVVL